MACMTQYGVTKFAFLLIKFGYPSHMKKSVIVSRQGKTSQPIQATIPLIWKNIHIAVFT
jgi:hypothetical protein